MESANNHHHQVVGSSCYGVGTTPHSWSTTPTSLMNSSEPMSSSRLQEHTLLPLQYDPNIDETPDLSFHDWANNNQSIQDLQQLPRIKEELSDHYYRKYADLLNNDEQNKVFPGDHWLHSSNGRGYSQVFPSNMNQMDMNLEALDLLTSSSFSGNLGSCSQNYNQIGILRDHEFTNYSTLDMQRQSHQVRLYETDKISAPIGRHESAETKRYSNKTKPKAPYQNATRKSSRSSCPPFKVRKEKLGDRIAALQQLVAPFGKTDTASVLMEAIGYIKFLQDQVETLSVPYMKASRNKSAVKEGLVDHQNEKDGEKKGDLKSRGLCLVPLSCLSYVTDGGAAVVWPPHHFGGPAGHLASNFSV